MMNSNQKFKNKIDGRREDGEDCMLTCPNLHLNLQTSHFARFKAKLNGNSSINMKKIQTSLRLYLITQSKAIKYTDKSKLHKFKVQNKGEFES